MPYRLRRVVDEGIVSRHDVAHESRYTVEQRHGRQRERRPEPKALANCCFSDLVFLAAYGNDLSLLMAGDGRSRAQRI